MRRNLSSSKLRRFQNAWSWQTFNTVRFATSGESAFSSNGSRFIRRGETANVSRISVKCKSRDFRSTRRGDASGSKSISARKHLEIHSIAFDGYSLESGEKARGLPEMNQRLAGTRLHQNMRVSTSPASPRDVEASRRCTARCLSSRVSSASRFNFRGKNKARPLGIRFATPLEFLRRQIRARSREARASD